MSEQTPIYPVPSPEEQRRANRSLMITLVALTAAVVAIVIIGFLCLNHPDNITEGQVDGTTVRISGKLPGRLAEVYVHEGDTIAAGDTLARIHSSVVEAQLAQAEAMRNVARAQNRKAEAGTRSQIIEAARDMLAQAEAAQTIAKKTYERMQNLYNDGVVTAQKRDEAKAAYDASTAQVGAARSQLNLALEGAQNEDKRSAAAMVSARTSASPLIFFPNIHTPLFIMSCIMYIIVHSPPTKYRCFDVRITPKYYDFVNYTPSY